MCVIYCSVAVLMCLFCTDRGIGVIQERVRRQTIGYVILEPVTQNGREMMCQVAN